MTTETIARLYIVAASRLLGDFGTSAIYYLGRALALRVLQPTQGASVQEESESWVNNYLASAKREFRAAARQGRISKRR